MQRMVPMIDHHSHGHLEPTGLTCLDYRPTPGKDSFLQGLLESELVSHEDWEQLPIVLRERLCEADDSELLDHLVEEGLLTDYQRGRIRAGTTFGLIMGNYRVLDRLGAGGMAVVFKAEHLVMRHQVAIKVLPITGEHDPRVRTRFAAEMRIVAQLRHPNIVAATDAGQILGPPPDQTMLTYMVMEYVPGQDLEEMIRLQGRLPPARACSFIHQIASALVETSKFNLIHRDIKPSNILVTPEDQAKLLDFGLSQRHDHRLTEPGTVLGTIDYMAPEQARDASKVDIRADIYGLGGTLFWCLTGRLPFTGSGNVAEMLMRRLIQPPPCVRDYAPDVSAELSAVVSKMMATQPEDRYPEPRAVMRALLPFLRPDSLEYAPAINLGSHLDRVIVPRSRNENEGHRILIVDDESSIRQLCKQILSGTQIICHEAENGPHALEMANQTAYDVILLDIQMPGMSGIEVLKRLRERFPGAYTKIILFSGQTTSDLMAEMLLTGADDFLTKPFSLIQLRSRVHAALRLKEAQDRSSQLAQHLAILNAELERNLSNRDSDTVAVRNALILALGRLVKQRDTEGAGHMARMQLYCRCLAQHAASVTPFSATITPAFMELLDSCSPLHDIGKIGLPDHILLKPGKLLPEERILMQTHTQIGADTLQEVLHVYPQAGPFLQMAIDITRHHHEHFDGSGYPDRLSGNAIPLSARIVTIGDVYDALRSRRAYKPALSHTTTLQLMSETCTGQFDPALFKVFLNCASGFEKIFAEHPD